MRVTADRIEGKYVVAETEDGRTVNIPLMLIPDAREGDVIEIRIDADETEKRKARIRQLADSIFED